MNTSHAIRHIRITPIAFRDLPLLPAAGIHRPGVGRCTTVIQAALVAAECFGPALGLRPLQATA